MSKCSLNKSYISPQPQMADKVKAFTKAEELVQIQLIIEISSFLVRFINYWDIVSLFSV